ncbi:MAG: class I SAM-dependent methyltransferase [Pirellulaceae bacterium]
MESQGSANRVWDSGQYELLDCGQGWKLERFGGRLVQRPSPAASGKPRVPVSRWQPDDCIEQQEDASWVHHRPADQPWMIRWRSLQMQLAFTPFGHLGVFPEHAWHWEWLQQQCHGASIRQTPLSALNLFAYTGGASLALADAGAQVAHIDSSKPAVAWARINAQHSLLSDRPIRWLVEDALKFCQREVRRGSRYQLIVLDPPAYGHGPDGKRWQLDRDLPKLLECIGELWADQPCGFLISGHGDENQVAQMVRDSVSGWGSNFRSGWQSGRSTLSGSNFASLDAGFWVRWSPRSMSPHLG